MILLLRHGETEWNVQRRLQGRLDSPLTALGRRQAEAMGRLVRDLMVRDAGDWRLVTSPLGRARDTAAALAAATGLHPSTDPRLAEVDCGEWEGRLFDEVHAGREGASRRLIFEAPGAEAAEAVRARIEAFLASLPPEPERRVIAVSHGVASRILRGAYLGLSLDEVVDLDVPHGAVWRLANGQIDRFDCEPVH
jgi:broad specificity phosphatase PhoE